MKRRKIRYHRPTVCYPVFQHLPNSAFIFLNTLLLKLLRTQNSKAFPLSPFRRILKTKYQHMDISHFKNKSILFISWIRMRSLFRTKLTTTDFRADEQTEVMRGLQFSMQGMSKLITRNSSRILMPWAWISVQDPQRPGTEIINDGFTFPLRHFAMLCQHKLL